MQPNYLIKFSFISIICLTLMGCFHFGSLHYKQVRMLKQEGFVQTEEGWTLGLPERLLFAFNDASVKAEHKPELARLAKQLQKYDLVKLKVVGHTDNIGLAAYNQTLSEQRARAVADILIANGFSADHLMVVGRGASQPLVDNNSDAQRAMNRRVALIVVP